MSKVWYLSNDNQYTYIIRLSIVFFYNTIEVEIEAFKKLSTFKKCLRNIKNIMCSIEACDVMQYYTQCTWGLNVFNPFSACLMIKRNLIKISLNAFDVIEKFDFRHRYRIYSLKNQEYCREKHTGKISAFHLDWMHSKYPFFLFSTPLS